MEHINSESHAVVSDALWPHGLYAAAAGKLFQSCPTLCDPTDDSLLGSSISGILQARTLEWVAISFSNAWKWKVKVKSLSRAQLLATPWTAAFHAPPSMGFLVGDKTVQNKETQNPTEPRGKLVMKKDSKRNNWWEEFSILLCYGQFLSHFWLFVTPWTAAHQVFLSFTISQSLLKFMSTESVILSNILLQ